MADKKTVFALDLDISKFTKEALSAKGQIEAIGSSENLSGLLEGLASASMAIGLVGVAALALKVTMDQVFRGEEIEKQNKLFESLTGNIGISGEALKQNMLEAAHGMASLEDIVQSSNRAIVTLGENASRLPEIMELSTKMAEAFGGTATEKFDQLTFAIASGSTRMLKANGIIIDVDKALRDYAMSLGVTKDALTEAGRQQAIMNAVLEYGEKKFKDVSTEAQYAIDVWQQLKVTLKSFADEVSQVFEKLFGNTLKTGLQYINNTFSVLTFLVKRYKGELTEAAEEQKMFSDEAIASNQKVEAARVESNKKSTREIMVDRHKEAEESIKLESELNKIRLENNKMRIETATSMDELERARKDRQLLEDDEFFLKKRKIEEDYETGKIPNKEVRDAMLEELEAQHQERMLEHRRMAEAENERMDENRLRSAENTFDGIGRAAEVSARRANASLNNFGKTGMMVMGVIQKRGAEAFEMFGKAAVDHSMTASQIMKHFFLNALADMAEAQGKLYLAAGLVDPSKLAAGAALLVLAGALRAMSGGGGASFGGGGGGYSGGDIGGAYSAADQPRAQAEEKKSVTVQIQGDFLNTEETQRKLLQYVRDATDATDFKYQQIGQS